MPADLLPIDDDATVWSVPRDHLATALAQRPLLVLLHGYGANERDLAGLIPLLADRYLVASVRAPLPIPAMPGGRAWFPLNVQDLNNPDPALANAASAGVLRWLETVQSQSRTSMPVGLLGFSQGGSIALQLLRHRPEDFTCAVVLSGFVVPGLLSGDTALEQIRPPVFWGHDDADPIIPPAAVDRLGAFLRGHTDLTARKYSGVGHGIGEPEMRDVLDFLHQRLR